MANKNSKSRETRLLPPRRVSLPASQYEEAVSLLADLLLDAADVKRGGVASGGATGGVSDGVMSGVIAFPQKRRKGREAA